MPYGHKSRGDQLDNKKIQNELYLPGKGKTKLVERKIRKRKNFKRSKKVEVGKKNTNHILIITRKDIYQIGASIGLVSNATLAQTIWTR